MNITGPVDPLFNARSFESQIDSIRGTVKWHVVALAAIAGVLVGGLKMTNLGALTDDQFRTVVTVAYPTFALIAGALVVCSLVLSARRPSLEELLSKPDLLKRVEAGPVLLLKQYGSVKVLADCYGMESHDFGNQFLITTQSGYIAAAEQGRDDMRVEAAGRLLECRLSAYEVLTYAQLLQTQGRYNICQIILGFGLMALLVLCMAFVRIVGGGAG